VNERTGSGQSSSSNSSFTILHYAQPWSNHSRLLIIIAFYYLYQCGLHNTLQLKWVTFQNYHSRSFQWNPNYEVYISFTKIKNNSSYFDLGFLDLWIHFGQLHWPWYSQALGKQGLVSPIATLRKQRCCWSPFLLLRRGIGRKTVSYQFYKYWH